MKYDETIRDRILLQVYQNDEFWTTRKCEAWHAALLIDEGYVDGEISVDKEVNCVQSVKIFRMKRKGFEKIDSIIHYSSKTPDYLELRQRLIEIIHKSEESHDKLIATLSAGGIGLFFTFLGLASNLFQGFTMSVKDYVFGGVALLSWSLALSLLLVSHFKSINETEKIIFSIDQNTFNPENSNCNRKILARINKLNATLTIVGIVAFSIFTVCVLAKESCVETVANDTIVHSHIGVVNNAR